MLSRKCRPRLPGNITRSQKPCRKWLGASPPQTHVATVSFKGRDPAYVIFLCIPHSVQDRFKRVPGRCLVNSERKSARHNRKVAEEAG